MDKLYRNYLIYIDREITQIFGMVEEAEKNARTYCDEYLDGRYGDTFEMMCDEVWTLAKAMLIQLYNVAYKRGCEVEDLNELFEGTGI